LKLGFELSEATVAKYMVRHRKPLSQTWRTFLANHMKDMVSLANCYFAHDSSVFPALLRTAMRNLVVLFIHLIATPQARLLGPGGGRTLVCGAASPSAVD
jgi:hypothetical protein